MGLRCYQVFTWGAVTGGGVSALSFIAILMKKKSLEAENYNINKPTTNSSPPPSNSDKGFLKEFLWGKKLLKEKVEVQNEKINYLNEKISNLGGIVVAVMNGIHTTDIEVKPGTKEASIHAHKAQLMQAVKSSIFRNILDLEDKAQSTTMSKMTNEEFQSLIEFLLYKGNLSKEMVEKHLYLLAVAADKYDIAPLRKVCEHHLKESLSTCNALDILELSDRCSNKSLKDATLDFIAKNYKDIFFSKGYVDFTINNPHLAGAITRARASSIK